MAINSIIKPIEILLVEDNPGDVRLTKEALKDAKIANNLNLAKDGAEAISFLRREGEYIGSVRPDLILMDLNLPKKNGLEVLKEIKCDPDLRRIPVVILSVSKLEEDIIKTYDNYANCYIIKPVDLNKFLEVIKSIEDFWFAIVKLPPNGSKP